MKRDGTSILAGTLLLSFLFSPGMRSAPEPTAQSDSSAEAAGSKAARRLVVQSAYELSPDDSERIRQSARKRYQDDLLQALQDECKAGDKTLTTDESTNCRLDLGNFIIALVPDPVHTHLALQFDRSIEAIEQALQDEHYLFVHSIMPWDPKTYAESDDHSERESSELANDSKQREPGLMIFRAVPPDGQSAQADAKSQQQPDQPSSASQSDLPQQDAKGVSGKPRMPPPSPLLVLVVGETPTGGIHKDQFRGALAEMQTWIRKNPARRKFDVDDGKTWGANAGSSVSPGLRIFGPTFSGSLKSLGELLQCPSSDDKHPAPPCHGLVSIHSGTASSYDSIKDFVRTQDGLHARFLSFQESDVVMIERFKEFLTGSAYGNRHYYRKNIALLSEDETAYGSHDSHNKTHSSDANRREESGESEDETAYGSPDSPQKAPSSNAIGRDKSAKNDDLRQKPEKIVDAYENIGTWFTRPMKKTAKWFKKTETGEWLKNKLRPVSQDADKTQDAGRPHQKSGDRDPYSVTIYFPREISQLRAAYQKDVVATAPEGRSTPRDILPSYSDVPGSDDDTVPSYSAHQMTLSQEAVMLGIVSELKQHQAQFVVVRATDPMDTLFLVRFLRTMYPQGRIVTVGADMLLRREAEDPRFHGLLSLSTYALSTAANHGFRDYEEDHIERVFPSTFEAGSYNAVRSLLVAWQVEAPERCPKSSSSPSGNSFQDPAAHSVQACRCKLSRHVADANLDPYQDPDQDPDQDPVSLYQYGWRQQPLPDEKDPASLAGYDAPPVRLLALGRDQYWPVAALGPFEGEEHATLLPRAPNELRKPLERVLIPNSWRVVQLAGLALAIFFCWSLWCSSIFSNAQPLARFAPAIRDRRVGLILTAGFTLDFILLILMWPAMHGAVNDGLGLEPVLLAALAAVFSITLLESISRTHRQRWLPLPKDAAPEPVSDEGVPEPSPSTIAPAPLAQAGGMAAAPALERKLQILPQATPETEAIPAPAVSVQPLPSKPRHRRRWRLAFLKRWWRVGLFLLGSFVLFFGVGVGEGVPENSALVRWYSMLRTVHLSSGLSFIMPTFFFLTVWLWWAEQVSSGLALLDERHPRLPARRPRPAMPPENKKHDPFQGLREKSFPELLADIRPRYCSLRWVYVAAIVLISFAFLMGVRHPMMSLEKPLPLEMAMTLLFLFAICGIIVTTLRIWEIWIGLRKLLLNLDMTPLRDVFKNIEGFSWKPIWRFGAGSLPEFLRIFSRVRDAMDDAIKLCPQLLDSVARPEITEEFRREIEEARSTPRPYTWDWGLRRQRERQVLERFGKYQEALAGVAGRALDFLADHVEDAPEKTKHSALRDLIPYLAKGKTAKRLRDDKLRARISACEKFACMSYVNVLLVMLVRIRTLIVAVGGMYVLTLVGISQYPFEPKGALQLLLVVLLAFVVSVVGLVFAQIHRDAVLSNLTDTNPGELGIDFYIRMASFIALPLFSLLASQFPTVNRFVYSWLQPALESLNR